MKKLIYILLLISIIGCASPYQKLSNQSSKISKSEDQLSVVELFQKQQASNMVYATDLALDKAEKSVPVDTAKDFNSRAQIILGQPKSEDASEMREIVSQLLSDLAKERIKGKKALSEVDVKIAKLESQKDNLQINIKAMQDKLEKLNQSNASLADKEKERESQWWNPFYDFGNGIKKSLVYVVIVLGLFLLLPIIGIIFPVAMPIISALGQVVGSAFGWLIKLIPGAIHGAGVVAKDAFDIANSTKNKLVEGIQLFKEEHKDTPIPLALGTTLSKVLNDDNKNNIIDTKKELGLL